MNPTQIVLSPQKLIPQSRIDFVKNKPNDRKQELKKGYKVLPSVYVMAKKTGYEELYTYFYYATSSLVHFRPDILAKMAWGTFGEDGRLKDYTVSIKNFSNYYLEFNLVYGTYLFKEFIGNHFYEVAMSIENKLDWIKKIDALLDRDWPELVTFEHMNIKPPSSIIRILKRATYNFKEE
ncbi:hypothetical protein HUW51_16350 [Adhaeribacter swui]|uniref:Uncharacterized protein n=1 Tax=Adhaeribacter swui TaxID=2086471 RepID=A0A7G7GAN1_9BACT|nr:hypothetical protein [Adhaeribacter swui]QNF34215.1 hypothetical protein HUW51_16350 [Adhaeribacter swui]